MLTSLAGLMETSIFLPSSSLLGVAIRKMACIVYKALLLLCINKYLQGSDKEKSAVSASQQKYQWALSWGTSTVETCNMIKAQTSLLSIIW